MLTLIGLIGLSLSSCNKDYYLDTGVHETNFNGNMYEYLKSDPTYFDSLVRIIDLAEMRGFYEKENVTFFAPTSLSIRGSLLRLNTYLRNNGQDTVRDMAQIKKEVWKDFLELYTIDGKYVFNDFVQIDTMDINAFSGQTYMTVNQTPMVLGAIHNNAGGVKYAGYRQLLYSYIQDLNNPKTSLKNAIVASSNIQPINGVVHVLQAKGHAFGFLDTKFILDVTNRGIDY